jgi:hypothetical protein
MKFSSCFFVFGAIGAVQVRVQKREMTRPDNTSQIRRFRRGGSQVEEELRPRDWIHIDKDLILAQKHVPPGFLATWKSGFRHYLTGRWSEARKNFESANRMMGGKDGPALTLLGFMEKNGWNPPARWSGVRRLSSK